jgi:copper ion binding protein
MTSTHDFSVPGISCGHCKAAIEETVGEVAGVLSVDVDVDAKTVAVSSDDSVTEAALVTAIDEAGYDVV